METHAHVRGILQAEDFGASPDGQDNTESLQTALDAAASSGGGRVQLNTGNYAVRGNLRIPDNVTLAGNLEFPITASHGQRSTLQAYAGRGEEEGTPFISLGENSGVAGLCVHYPEQTGDVQPYPWCIQTRGGSSPTIRDCLLVNPYQAIDLGNEQAERHFVSGVYGTPLRRGLSIDRVTDIGRVENVHFWPFFKEALDNPAMRQFVQQEGEAFIIARSDWQYMSNTFSWGYRVGYRFAESKWGVCNGQFSGIGADACNVSVLVENSAPYGILIDRGQFVAIFGEEPRQIHVRSTNRGTVQFNNCSFWGLGDQVACVEGKGHVTFQACNFVDWRPTRPEKPCLEVQSGTAIVNACRFGKGGVAVHVAKGVDGAIVNGNLFQAEDAVEIEPGAHAEAAGNLAVRQPQDRQDGAHVMPVTGRAVTLEGTWPNHASGNAYCGHYYFCPPWHGGGTAKWFPQVSPGRYSLSFWTHEIPERSRQYMSGRLCFELIDGAGGRQQAELDLRTAETGWTQLGEFMVAEGDVIEMQNAGEGVMYADALMLTPLPASCAE